jgi:hypothetical protein
MTTELAVATATFRKGFFDVHFSGWIKRVLIGSQLGCLAIAKRSASSLLDALIVERTGLAGGLKATKTVNKEVPPPVLRVIPSPLMLGCSEFLAAQLLIIGLL